MDNFEDNFNKGYETGKELSEKYWWWNTLATLIGISFLLLFVIPFTPYGWMGEYYDFLVFAFGFTFIGWGTWKYQRDGSLW